jgi:SAM-dependent methyltransferase
MDPEDLDRNRRSWDAASAAYQRRNAPRLPTDEPTWGVWGLPERELRALGDVAGLDVLELGCGGAQWSIALARRGARVTGLDLSAAQLASARARIAEAGVPVRLVHASATATGLAAVSFDLVFADHGALNFADAADVLPEVARILRPGGRLVFNAPTPWLECCRDRRTGVVGPALSVDYFGGLGRIEEEGMVSFVPTYGEWIRLFARAGLRVDDLVELRAPEDAWTTYSDYAPPGWARRWPGEQIWKVSRP